MLGTLEDRGSLLLMQGTMACRAAPFGMTAPSRCRSNVSSLPSHHTNIGGPAQVTLCKANSVTASAGPTCPCDGGIALILWDNRLSQLGLAIAAGPEREPPRRHDGCEAPVRPYELAKIYVYWMLDCKAGTAATVHGFADTNPCASCLAPRVSCSAAH